MCESFEQRKDAKGSRDTALGILQGLSPARIKKK
jgi:hypothetical protein